MEVQGLDLYCEVEELLKDLIAIDTRQEVSCELPAAQYLAAHFERRGIEHTIFEPGPGRASVVARIQGEEDESIVLHSHLDTAHTDQDGWKVDPLSPTVIGERIFGRGALDCKGLCAVWAAVMHAISQGSQRPQKTIVFAATADEESGGALGTQWLYEYTEVFSTASLVLGEGGGFGVTADGREYYTVQTGERSVITLAADQLPICMSAEVAVQQGIEAGLFGESTWQYLTATDFSPRRLDPESFEAVLLEYDDRGHSIHRPLPFLATAYRSLSCLYFLDGGGCVDLSFQLAKLQEVLGHLGLSGTLLPTISPGYSDNRFFRQHGVPTIGFFPVLTKNALSGIHGPNEYITRSNLQLALDILLEAVRQFSQLEAAH